MHSIYYVWDCLRKTKAWDILAGMGHCTSNCAAKGQTITILQNWEIRFTWKILLIGRQRRRNKDWTKWQSLGLYTKPRLNDLFSCPIFFRLLKTYVWLKLLAYTITPQSISPEALRFTSWQLISSAVTWLRGTGEEELSELLGEHGNYGSGLGDKVKMKCILLKQYAEEIIKLLIIFDESTSSRWILLNT